MTKTIDKFNGKYYFLSNSFSAPITYQGIEYPTNEHAYQSSKTNSEYEKKQIQACYTPEEAIKLGNVITKSKIFEDNKNIIMSIIVHNKFVQNSELVKKLLNTENEELIDGNILHDNYWGQCKCPQCINSINGKNMLGKMLMDERKWWS